MRLKNNVAGLRVWMKCLGWILIFACFSGCGVYSFTGAALSPEIQTISIDNFYNDAGNGPPNMSQLFTEEIRDYYQSNTRLALVPENGDLLIEGAITRYEFVPVAPRSSGSNEVADVASLIRLNITVSASYINTYNDEYNFENKSFTFFADFDSERDPSSVEEELIEEIFDQIIFDIFTASVANW
ncbi:MAG: LptE family protein [Cyclobacteriaceae bacterium]